ncbi:related to cytochrome P450 family protein [Ramularia collo-cygni]|uniref:Related to cytochrome P450 family protein n=1 Tax=Ramularia collo-cygni TaxID=112498 RepID=A0A2D3URL3_9PEZI|nr:related to cytochrome P450 family protein [Ramularia collo-cygni]CZT17218.1 related to cytochrome P450 family protein [Ramularia collo-cygni]
MRKAREDLLDDIFGDDVRIASTTQRTQFEGTTSLLTVEPANVQAMLATQFKDFELGAMRINQFYPLLGSSIFTSDGRFWEHSRALFRPQFNRESLNDLEGTEDAVRDLIDAISAGMDGFQEVELLPLLQNFTLDTATSFLFGESVKSQRCSLDEADGLQGSKQFREDFEFVNKTLLNRIRLQSAYWLADGRRFRKAVARIRAFTEQFVEKALNASQPGKVTSKKYNLLSALATQCQDREELQNQSLAVLLAGRDSTAALLGWAFTRLALHSEIFHDLRRAILNDFNTQKSITATALKSCRPLQHFFNEVLRLHPVVPINNRQAVRDTTLPRGGGPDETMPIAIKKGQVVTFSVYLMHRRVDLWGEDALSFRPERWAQRIPSWQFLPFSGGPRVCIGQQFALIEASYILVRMLQQYDAIEPVDRTDMAALKKGLGLTMWPADSVNVRMHRAR